MNKRFYLLSEIFRQPAKIKKFNRLPTKIENFNRLPTKLLTFNRQPRSGPPIQTLKYSVYEKLPRVFLHRRFLFWREIRPSTPVLLTIHFSAAMKTLVFGNLFKLLRLASTFAREVYHLGIKMKTIYIWQSSYSSHQYPQQQIARANVPG